ncbi:hepcidin [Mixophyes fleayi]|uniref:hepcidin n=1 Tax=Mixophyes fleayi TaxID=3061075 RepID=UPI003F4DC993
MKGSALCALLILSALCQRSLSASIRGNEMMNYADYLPQTQMEEYNVQESPARIKRHSVLSVCTYCCNCCGNKGCGYCCRT